MSGWQPRQHEPRRQRPATPPQWQQSSGPDPWAGSAPSGGSGYRQSPVQSDDPRWTPLPAQPPAGWYPAPRAWRPHPLRRQTSLYVAWTCAATAALLAAGGWYTALRDHHGGKATATAQPDTETGARTAASAFYAFFSAGQWNQAWTGLAPSVQAKVPESTWTAVHDACPGAMSGLAREIKSVTVSGTTAVVSETVAGTLSKLATVSDAWTYTGSRWGLALPDSDTAVYRHSSVKADVAAAKKAGVCR